MERHNVNSEWRLLSTFINLGLMIVVVSSGVPSVNGVRLPKCCPTNQIYNRWQQCEKLPHQIAAKSSFEVLYQNNLCDDRHQLTHPSNNSICQQIGRTPLTFSWSPQVMGCPRRSRSEFKVRNVFKNGTIRFQDFALNAVDLSLDDGGGSFCTDLAIDGDEVESPFIQVCPWKYQFEDTPPGSVKKCCARDQIMDLQAATPVRCVDLAENGIDAFRADIPSTRLVRDPVTGSAVFKNFLQFANLTDFCHHMDFDIQKISMLYNNGMAVVEGDQKKIKYGCVDFVIGRQPGKAPILGALHALTCREQNCHSSVKRTCVPKCCSANQIYDTLEERCLDKQEAESSFMSGLEVFDATIYPHELKINVTKLSTLRELKLVDNQLRVLNKTCDKKVASLYRPDTILKFLSDGSLYFHGIGAWDDDFCIDTFLGDLNGTAERLSGFKCTRSITKFKDTNQKQCFGEDMSSFMKMFRLAYMICGFISIFFLSVTLYLYLSLPSLCNLHGKIVVSNIVSILFSTVCLLLLFNARARQDEGGTEMSSIEFVIDLSPLPCKSLGYLTYYSGITMFSWMSVMCYDLGWTFARAKIPRSGTDYFKFLLYSVVGWGIPLSLLIFVALVDNDIFPEGTFGVMPEVGENSCFLSIVGLQKYFYPPISIMLCFNTIMFFITVYALWKTKKFSRKAGIKRVASTWKSNEDNKQSLTPPTPSFRNRILMSNSETSQSTRKKPTCSDSSGTREEMILFVKLFFIMGLSWLSEVIHIELHGDHSGEEYCNFPLEVFLRILGVFNMLRGVFIFIIFICKPSIGKAISETHPRINKVMTLCSFRSAGIPDNDEQPQVSIKVSDTLETGLSRQDYELQVYGNARGSHGHRSNSSSVNGRSPIPRKQIKKGDSLRTNEISGVDSIRVDIIGEEFDRQF